jgi:hypothetical protein
LTADPTCPWVPDTPAIPTRVTLERPGTLGADGARSPSARLPFARHEGAKTACPNLSWPSRISSIFPPVPLAPQLRPTAHELPQVGQCVEVVATRTNPGRSGSRRRRAAIDRLELVAVVHPPAWARLCDEAGTGLEGFGTGLVWTRVDLSDDAKRPLGWDREGPLHPWSRD